MPTATYALANTHDQANTIVSALKDAGFPDSDISVLFPDPNHPRELPQDDMTKATEGVVAGVISGSVVGGALGWMAGIGLLTIPGVGPFLAAGPILALLSGAAVGAAFGSLTGSFIGLGMLEVDARHYESQIRAGRILIAVHADDHEWSIKATQVLKDAGAHDISNPVYVETTSVTEALPAKHAQHGAKH